MKSITAISIAFLIALSFWLGVRYEKKRTRAEIILAQAITLESQKSEIEILKEKRALKTKQIKQTIEDIANKAHEDLFKIEMGEK